MATAMYDNALKEFALGNIAWKASGGSTIKAMLVDVERYTFSASHKSLSDIPTGARIGTSATLELHDAGEGGVCDAEDVTISNLQNTPSIEAVVLYKDTGVEATSTLIIYMDEGVGLPTPASINSVAIRWDDGPNKIFKL